MSEKILLFSKIYNTDGSICGTNTITCKYDQIHDIGIGEYMRDLIFFTREKKAPIVSIGNRILKYFVQNYLHGNLDRAQVFRRIRNKEKIR